MSDELKSTLSRWSQRKLAARRGEAADDASAEAHPLDRDSASVRERQEPSAGVRDEAAASATGEDVPELPPIDELNAQSDYTQFMAKNVPESLRRAALRKLWTSDPVFANLDGLNDYDEDYNLIDQAITVAQTSYRPGQGYLDEIEKKLTEAEDADARTAGGPSELPAESDAVSAEPDAEESAAEPERGFATKQREVRVGDGNESATVMDRDEKTPDETES